MTWRDLAACRHHPDVFDDHTFTIARNRRPTRAERQAIQICQLCPVRNECLAEELVNMRAGAISIGVFGGTTPHQRHQTLKGTP